ERKRHKDALRKARPMSSSYHRTFAFKARSKLTRRILEGTLTARISRPGKACDIACAMLSRSHGAGVGREISSPKNVATPSTRGCIQERASQTGRSSYSSKDAPFEQLQRT